MTLSNTNRCLVNEIRLLQRCQKQFGLRAKLVIDQLIAWTDAPLPDQLPPQPQWIDYQWPASSEVDFSGYWREVDSLRRLSARDRSKWMGPYL